MDEFLSEHIDDPLPVGTPPCLLVESAFMTEPDMIRERIYQIVRKGQVPLLAHAERYERIDCNGQKAKGGAQSAASLLNRIFSRFNIEQRISYIEHPASSMELLRDMGCLFQGNIGSFAGRYGEPVRQKAMKYLENGFYDRLATDAHRFVDLEIWLESGLKTVEKVVGNSGMKKLLGDTTR